MSHSPSSGDHTRSQSIHAMTMALADAVGTGLSQDKERIYAPDAQNPSQELRQSLCRRLDDIRSGAETDPFSNSVSMLALDISRLLHKGKLSMSDLESLVQRLTLSGFSLRADGIADYLSPVDPEKNDQAVERMVRILAGLPEKKSSNQKSRDHKPVPFEIFRDRVETELFGIVFTAHPTFGLSKDLLHVLCQVATGHDHQGQRLSDHALQEKLKYALSREHRPEQKLTLDVEHALSLEAICNLQAALRRVYDILFSVAGSLYGDRAKELVPCLISVASWVGYDIDGRSDITWADTLHKRLHVQRRQLEYYRDAIGAVRNSDEKSHPNEALQKSLEILESLLSVALKETEDEIEIFSGYEIEEDSSVERIRALAKKMHEGLHLRLTETDSLIKVMNMAIDQCGKDTAGTQQARALNILRAEIAHYGLGMAHTHVRINASQLHNAIRKTIGMTSPPDDPKNRRTYLKALEKLLQTVQPSTINFGSIMAERMSGKRLFMSVAQMLKYIDSATPVRFLIAECETPLTILTALFLAKQFGVEDKVDISPLFETEKAMAQGHRIIDECLNNRQYRAYVRQRGRLCIQTGFSDAGRYLGQTAASLSIENLQRNIARTMDRHDLKDVRLVVFDTHGESIGRGGHPVSLRDRLEYVSCPYSRQLFAQKGLSHKEEITFQGGDGYRYFMNPTGAYAVVARILEYCIEPSTENSGDPFYEEAFHAAEMVNTIKQFNAEVMDDPDYAVLLGAFGINMLHTTGSRPVVRQHEGGSTMRSMHPSQTRAIPQNAILQQMGMLANTLGGVGQAWVRDSELLKRFFKDSPRFRRVMGMVEYAFAFSEIEVFKAYIDCFDPGLWLARAARSSDETRSEEMKRLSVWLEKKGPHECLLRIYRVFQREYVEIHDWLLGRKQSGRLAVGRGRVMAKEQRDDLLLLHGIRVALIQEVFLYAMRIPEFNFPVGHNRDQLIAKLVGLEVEPVLDVLAQIFPVSPGAPLSDDFGEKATYRNDDALDYRVEHGEVFEPIAKLHHCIRRISTGITYFVGATG